MEAGVCGKQQNHAVELHRPLVPQHPLCVQSSQQHNCASEAASQKVNSIYVHANHLWVSILHATTKAWSPLQDRTNQQSWHIQQCITSRFYRRKKALSEFYSIYMNKHTVFGFLSLILSLICSAWLITIFAKICLSTLKIKCEIRQCFPYHYVSTPP